METQNTVLYFKSILRRYKCTQSRNNTLELACLLWGDWQVVSKCSAWQVDNNGPRKLQRLLLQDASGNRAAVESFTDRNQHVTTTPRYYRNLQQCNVPLFLIYTVSGKKKSLWFTMHNCNKFEYIFTVFGTNHRDSSFLPRDARSAKRGIAIVSRPSVRPSVRP